MICPNCKEGRLLYLTHESKVTPAYDYVILVTHIFLECEQCKAVRREEHVVTTGGSIPVGPVTAERIRASGTTSPATTAEPKSEAGRADATSPISAPVPSRPRRDCQRCKGSGKPCSLCFGPSGR